MAKPINKFVLVGKGGNPLVRDQTKLIAAFIQSKGGEVRYESDIAEALGEKGGSVLELDSWAEAYITVGGDGTILFTQQNTEKPVLGINAGAIGFLAEVEPPQAKSALELVMKGEYQLEHRTRLASFLDGVRLPDAVNELTLQTRRIAKLIRFTVRAENEVLDTYRADGIIVATATGSTGYAMSVGGPLVHPQVGGIVLAPIAPFRLSARPWIVPETTTLELELLERDSAQGVQQAKVVIDGQHPYDVQTGAKILIRKSKRPATFIRLGEGFYERVRTKLTR